VCLAVPGKIIRIDGEMAEVEIGGIRREASLSLIQREGLKEGEYVLIHTGFAIAKIDEGEARSILETWREILAAERAD